MVEDAVVGEVDDEEEDEEVEGVVEGDKMLQMITSVLCNILFHFSTMSYHLKTGELCATKPPQFYLHSIITLHQAAIMEIDEHLDRKFLKFNRAPRRGEPHQNAAGAKTPE